VLLSETSAILALMPTSIAILGASGAVGSALAAHILRSQLLQPLDRLQLVGHGSHHSEGILLGTRIDLLDAFDDERVDIEVVPKIIDVDADIVVIASGVSMSAECNNRRDMGIRNRELFEEIAEDCALQVPESLFIVVSNPVELAVRILTGKLHRHRVIGMGAQQDSLRFARAIAHDLDISRREVHASVAGEHGQAMVPLWSTVELLEPTLSLRSALSEIKTQSTQSPLHERVTALQSKVSELLQTERIPEAYEAAHHELPDARIFVEPFITAHCMQSTPNATSNATLQLLAAALAPAENRRRIHGQVLLQGEALGLTGVCGVPVTLGREGWRHEALDRLDSSEKKAIAKASQSIGDFAAHVLAEPPAAQ
jgi:malate dehydrogenase